MTAALAVTRTFHFASLMAIFGGGAYLLLLRRKLKIVPRFANRLEAWFALAAGLALLTSILWLCLATGQMSGDWRAAFDVPTVARAITGTHFGTIFAIRIAGLILLLIAAIWTRVRRMEILVAISALLLSSLGLTSHAAASAELSAGYLGAASDAAHLLAAGFWTGGLALLALLIPDYLETPAGLIAPLRLFSLWGTYVVAALVLSGVVNTILILGPPLLRPNAYGGVLAAKIIVALAMIGLAAVNRWHIAPELGRDDKAPHQLKLTVTTELGLGVVVIAAAAILGLLPPE